MRARGVIRLPGVTTDAPPAPPDFDVTGSDDSDEDDGVLVQPAATDTAPDVSLPQNRFLDAAFAGKNIFLTGMAGTGKSTLLRGFIDGMSDPDSFDPKWPDGTPRPVPHSADGAMVSITAPTGIAALNIGGHTIHRWAGMLLGPSGSQTDEAYFKELREKPFPSIRNGFRRVECCKCLVIDEISMLSGRTFQFLEWLFRRLRADSRPWGGCQVIAIGDFLQLAPVKKSADANYDWAFLNTAWEASGFTPVELTKVHRQSDEEFIRALADVRIGDLSASTQATLKKRVVNFPPAHLPRLFTHNAMVNQWNESMLADLPGDEQIFHGIKSGNMRNADFLAENLTCPEELHLKVGARVMCTINDRMGRFVNGSIGIVTGMNDLGVEVDLGKGGRADIERVSWNLGEEGNKGFYSQFPLRLAYAMTIHKSQGLSLDEAYMDIRAAREPGQAYVALSRVRKLSGLHLKEWFSGVFISEAAIEFHRKVSAAR